MLTKVATATIVANVVTERIRLDTTALVDFTIRWLTVFFSKYAQTYPKSFEAIGQDRGFVLYETQLVKMFTDPAQLSISVHFFSKGPFK